MWRKHFEEVRPRYEEEEDSSSGETAVCDSSLSQLPAAHPMDALTETFHAESERTQQAIPNRNMGIRNFMYY